jgi:hypothetical protein
MAIEDVLARTKRRKAEGANQSYPEHAAGATATAASAAADPKPVSPALRHQLAVLREDCPDLGAEVRKGSCGPALHRCNRFGDLTTKVAPCADARRTCAGCDHHPAKKRTATPGGAGAVVRLTVSANGIGDHLCGLSLAAGWKAANPAGTLWLDAKPGAKPWLELFGGYDGLGPGPAGAVPLHDLAKRGDRHYVEAAAAAGPRALPERKPLPAEAVAWAEAHRGSVVLVPRCAHAARNWLRSHWLRLEALLADRGFACVVVGSAGDRASLEGFRSPAHCGESPARIAALMRAAACVVSNESGMAHLAGALGVPVVVLAAQLSGKQIHGFWPRSVQVQGPLACSGCRFTGVNFRPHCGALCASLQAIEPEAVAAAVAGQVAAHPAPPAGPPALAPLLRLVGENLGGTVTPWGRADRDRTLGWLFREMYSRFPRGARVVETGCVRERDDWGAGYFGWLCGMYLEAVGAGDLTSVDIDPGNVATARGLLARWPRVRVVESCSAAYLAARAEPVDVCYLDSHDTYVPGHAEHALAEARAAAPLVSADGVVVFDDTPPDGNGGWHGKGRLAVPWLLDHGWAVEGVSGYQTVLTRRAGE